MTREEFKKLAEGHPRLDVAAVMRAYDFAARAHEGQNRVSGEPYITHPAQVAATLVDIGLDTPTVAAALLHDVCEDTPVTLVEIKKEFGEEVAAFVDGATKLDKFKYTGAEHQAETLRKMFLAVAEDVRVALIKLADRMHNMETIEHLPATDRYRISLETMEIYAPLAHRLGIGEWKGRLEDLAFLHVYPKEYAWLTTSVQEAYEARRAYIAEILPEVRRLLAEDGIEPLEMHARPKHYWSLYQKLLRHDIDLGKIYDLVAIRVIVRTVEECYATLGIIHKHWMPLPGRIKDYIALPKGSGYQSLHTTVFCIGGKIVEFQIRTADMHKEAEFGIAAHWDYAEKHLRNPFEPLKKKRRPEEDLAWIRQIQAWQKAVSGSKEFLDALKLDFLKNRVFIFTPKGNVFDLPAGATAIDFAYAIHTEVGHRAVGARADGKIIPLDEPLPSGAVVEVLTKKDPEPKRDWLTFVKTNEAKRKIRGWFNQHEGKRFAHLVALPEKAPQKQKAKPERRGAGADQAVVTAGGAKDVLMVIARCCNPLPGDEIKGYVTRGRGVSVHKISCKAVSRPKDRDRLIEVSWQIGSNSVYPATVKIYAEARVGLIKDISEAISKKGVNILNMTSFETPEKEGITIVTVEARSKGELEDLVKKIKSIKGVYGIDRV